MEKMAKKIKEGSIIIVRSCSRLKECKKPCLGFLSIVKGIEDTKIYFKCSFVKENLKKSSKECYIINGKDRFLFI